MKRVLITGAAGFVGSHFARKLIQKGFSLVGIDKFSDYYSPQYKLVRLQALEIASNFEIHNFDLNNFERLNSIVEKFQPEYIVHFAAQAGIRLPLDKSEVYINDNILSFLNIIKSAQRNKVKGIMYASSSSVYGDENEIPFLEDSIELSPKSFYGLTKLMNEKMSVIFGKTGNLQMRGLRFFTVYGPWGRPDMAYFRLAASALGEYSFDLFGDGSIKRDFTNIDDVVDISYELFLDLIKKEDAFNDIVNVGGGYPQSMLQLVGEIRKFQEVNFDINIKESNKLDSKITMASDIYLKSLIGNHNFKPLSTGVRELMTWAKEPEIKGSMGKWISSSS